MIITMSYDVRKSEIKKIIKKVENLGYETKLFNGVKKSVIHIIGASDKDRIKKEIEQLSGVEKLVPILHPFKLVSREFEATDSVIDIDGVKIGGNNITIMAGPCAVESEDSLFKIADSVKNGGAKILRGGAFKPRTSPYSFQGLGQKGLEYLAKARERTGLKIVTEVVSVEDVPIVAQYADILQIGARNMQNYSLLKTVGRFNKPVLLKRGISATIKEFLMAAEYIVSEGNPNVILCERGIRTYEKYTRNTLDISAVPVIKYLSHLPVIIDPSHAAGDWKFVGALAKAGIAAGSNGIIVEVHNEPEKALSDGKQSLNLNNYKILMTEIKAIAKAIGRRI
jgi:3-deoxy-7-phosphoheptulonate synthase